jgi:hypothetical protein
MCLSTFLAQVIGWFFFVMYLGLLINQAHYKKVMSDFYSNQPLYFSMSSIWLVFGLLIVLTHNVWVSDWPILITLIGWIVLLQGAFRLLAPAASIQFMKNMQAKLGLPLICWIWLLIGLYLIWVGHSTCCSC